MNLTYQREHNDANVADGSLAMVSRTIATLEITDLDFDSAFKSEGEITPEEAELHLIITTDRFRKMKTSEKMEVLTQLVQRIEDSQAVTPGTEAGPEVAKPPTT